MSYLQTFNYTTYIPSSLGHSAGPGAFQHSTSFGSIPHNRFTSYNSNNNGPIVHHPQFQNIPQIPNSIVPNVENPNGGDYYGNPIDPSQQYYANSDINNNEDSFNSHQPQPQLISRAPVQVAPGPGGRRRKAKKVTQRNAAIPFNTPVTPIQGPIYIKDGLVPVVPLYSYPAVNNGSLYQIPILWTALSYALGLEIRGEILRGLPCIKRLNQLFCPTAGNTYPLDHIERFIDENKALIKRMYGEFVMVNSEAFAGPVAGNYLRRSAREIYEDEVPDYFTKPRPNHLNTGNATTEDGSRNKRQTVNPRNGSPTQQPKSNRVDSCESKVEITTPYWAANSGGKVRAIVNTQHFEQAIHQEVCAKTSTGRCAGDCGCEQKYKWHRLLAYDPDNDCKGIFMDWFLFPSCCVCRCNPQPQP